MKVILTEELYQYAKAISKTELPVLSKLRKKTETLTGSHMQITVDQGQFMAMLTKILGVKKYLEVGVFTGYSTLAVTLAMDDESSISYALDIDAQTMAIAEKYWKMANVLHKIKPIIGDAVLSLNKLVDEGHGSTFDMAFIDAKKSDYIAYFEHCYCLIKIGGIILVDNVFMHGNVVAEKPKGSAMAINAFNHYLQTRNVDYCVTTIADGLTIIRKT